jgi:hypothetical protein
VLSRVSVLGLTYVHCCYFWDTCGLFIFLLVQAKVHLSTLNRVFFLDQYPYILPKQYMLKYKVQIKIKLKVV